MRYRRFATGVRRSGTRSIPGRATVTLTFSLLLSVYPAIFPVYLGISLLDDGNWLAALPFALAHFTFSVWLYYVCYKLLFNPVRQYWRDRFDRHEVEFKIWTCDRLPWNSTRLSRGRLSFLSIRWWENLASGRDGLQTEMQNFHSARKLGLPTYIMNKWDCAGAQDATRRRSRKFPPSPEFAQEQRHGCLCATVQKLQTVAPPIRSHLQTPAGTCCSYLLHFSNLFFHKLLINLLEFLTIKKSYSFHT